MSPVCGIFFIHYVNPALKTNWPKQNTKKFEYRTQLSWFTDEKLYQIITPNWHYQPYSFSFKGISVKLWCMGLKDYHRIQCKVANIELWLTRRITIFLVESSLNGRDCGVQIWWRSSMVYKEYFSPSKIVWIIMNCWIKWKILCKAGCLTHFWPNTSILFPLLEKSNDKLI